MSNVPNVDGLMLRSISDFLLIGDFEQKSEELRIVTEVLDATNVAYRTKNVNEIEEPILVVPGLGSIVGLAVIYGYAQLFLRDWQRRYSHSWDSRPMVVA